MDEVLAILGRVAIGEVRRMVTCAIDQICQDINHALAADPRTPRRVVDDEFDRLRAVGIALPYTGERLPLTPAVVPGSWCTALDVGCRAVFAGIDAIFRGAFAGDVDRLADFLLFSIGERELLRVNAGGFDWAVTARPDFMVGSHGPAVIETNITTSIGLLESGLLADILLRIPAVADAVAAAGLTTVNPAARLADAVARAAADIASPFVVLADWPGELDVWLFLYRYLACLLSERGVSAQPALVSDLDVKDGGVFFDGRRVDLVYRFFTTTALRDPETAARHEPLLRAVRAGTVRMFGSYGHKLFTPKVFLALLSDERYKRYLPDDILRAVHAVVPWTRILEERHTLYRGTSVDLVEFSANHREELVLKPNLGFGGRGVCVGAKVSQAQWESSIAAALASDEHWLVQERIDSPEPELAFLTDTDVVLRRVKVDYGVFMIERGFAGMARRNATSATGRTLTNLSLGGGLGPMFFLPGA